MAPKTKETKEKSPNSPAEKGSGSKAGGAARKAHAAAMKAALEAGGGKLRPEDLGVLYPGFEEDFKDIKARR